MYSDSPDDDDDDDISLKSTRNTVFIFAVLLTYAKAFMTQQIVKNPDISTNLKNVPRWRFLDQRQRHVWGENRMNGGSIYELSRTVQFISRMNYIITSDLQNYVRKYEYN